MTVVISSGVVPRVWQRSFAASKKMPSNALNSNWARSHKDQTRVGNYTAFLEKLALCRILQFFIIFNRPLNKLLASGRMSKSKHFQTV